MGHSLGLFSRLQDPLSLIDTTEGSSTVGEVTLQIVIPDGNFEFAPDQLSQADLVYAQGMSADFVTDEAQTYAIGNSAPIAQDSMAVILGWLPLLRWILLVGIITSMVLVTFRFVRCLRRIRAHRVTEFDEEISDLVATLAQQLKLRRIPRVIVSDVRFGPAVLGVFRHVVVLPRCLVADLRCRDPKVLRPILAHELLHIRRGDLWTGTLQAAVQCLWWFHPAVWIVNRFLSRETERCCDEQVVAELSCPPVEYARSLLSVIECKQSLQPVPVFPGMKPVEIRSQRMERIMSLTQGSQTRMPWWSVVAVLLFAVVVLPGAVVGQQAVDPVATEVVESNVEGAQSPESTDSKDVEISGFGMLDVVTLADPKAMGPKEMAAILKTAQVDGFLGTTLVAVVNGKPVFVDDILGPMRVALEADAAVSVEKRTSVLEAHLKSHISNYVEQEIVLHAMNGAVSEDEQAVLEATLEEPFQQCISHLKDDRDVTTDAELEESLANQGQTIDLLRKRFVRIQKVAGYLATLAGPPVNKEARRIALKKLRDTAVVVTIFDDDNGVPETFPVSKSAPPHDNRTDETIGRGDIIEVTFATSSDSNSQLTIPIRIAKDGTGSIPEIGRVEFADLNVSAVESRLAEAAEKLGLYNDPVVTVSISHRQQLVVRVLGAVDQPGTYKGTPGDFHVLDAIALAGGLKGSVDDNMVLRRPLADGGTAVILLSVKSVATNGIENLALREGDVLVVEAAAELTYAQKMQVSLSTPVSVSIKDEPVTEVLRQLAVKGGIGIMIITTSNSLDENKLNERVSMEVDDEPLLLVVGRLCRQLGLEYHVKDQGIQIRQRKEFRYNLRVYDVADLVVPIAEMVPAGTDAQTTEADFTGLVELIKTTVEPDTWHGRGGGGGRMSPEENTLSLVIRQTAAVHEQIVELLSQLRALQDVQVATNFRVEQFSSPAQLRWLERNVTFHKRSGSHPWALLPVDSDGLIAPSPEEAGSRLGDRKITAFVGQETNLEFTIANHRQLRLLLTGVPMADDKLLNLKFGVSGQPRENLRQHQAAQIVGNSQTLLLDVTKAVKPSFGFASDSRMSQSEREAAERSQREEIEAADARTGRIVLMISPTVVRLQEEELILGTE